MPAKKTIPQGLPSGAGKLAALYPKVWEHYAALGESCSEAGVLDARSRRLVKIALAVGAGLEGAVHSHVRRSRADNVSDDEIRHIVLLAIPTLGLPSAVRAKTWIDDLLNARPKSPVRNSGHSRRK